MFTWKPIYRELAERLMTYRDRQKELIAILAGLQKDGFKVVSLRDKVAANRECDLEEIDPFTFFASFNRGTNDEKRIGILRSLKELLKLPARYLPARYRRGTGHLRSWKALFLLKVVFNLIGCRGRGLQRL